MCLLLNVQDVPSPLMIAIWKGHESIAKLLLSHNAATHQRDQVRYAPLGTVSQTESQRRSLILMTTLLLPT